MKKQIKLNLGCGLLLAEGFINVDKAYSRKQLSSKRGIFKEVVNPSAEYVRADICKLPFPDDHADYVESVATFEHLPFKKVLPAFAEVRRVMKPGAKFTMITTNFDQLARSWLEKVARRKFDSQEVLNDFQNLAEVIYGNQFASGEFHCVPFNPPFLFWILQKTGFDLERDVVMGIHPAGSSQLGEKITTWDFGTDGGCRTEMICVEAWKR